MKKNKTESKEEKRDRKKGAAEPPGEPLMAYKARSPSRGARASHNP